jgi:diguanylate cyclase (GGDEF)-like protein
MPTSGSSRHEHFPPGTNWDEELFVLNYATRLFMAITDKKSLIQTALETFADFSRTQQVGLMTVDEKRLKLTEAGFYDHGKTTFASGSCCLKKGSYEHEIVMSREIRECFLDTTTFPWITSRAADHTRGLSIPVARSSQELMALVVLITDDQSLDFETQQRLRVLASVFALSLENMRLFELAIFDGLTGVHVRRYFEIRALEEMAKMKRTPQHLGIILMDIDDFKLINDRFGHVVGDKVLVEFAREISRGLRQDIDIVCRYGGDEFVILLPQTNPQQTRLVAQRILDSVSQHVFKPLPKGYEVSISAGAMCVGPHEPIPLQTLLHQVDKLLYKGKQCGGHRVVTPDTQ